MRSLFPLIAAVALLPAAAYGQAAPAEPRVDALFATYDRPGSPGCAVGVVQDGRLTYSRGYGAANLDYELPLTPSSVFYVASVSKQFSAAVMALLDQQGRLSLDDDVRKYVPELPNYGHTITIRHLVHHTSGLRDYLALMSLAGLRTSDVHPDQEVLDLIVAQKGVNFAPGEEHLYNNTGYFLMSEIVKRTTGQTLRQYAHEQIFAPLGMRNTHFHDDRNHVVRNRAHSYAEREGGGYQLDYWANFDKVGSGGLLTTVEDLALWDQNFYTGRVGGPRFLELIHTRGVLNGGDTLSYAFGNNVAAHRGLRTVSHGGTSMGFRAHLLRFPDQRFSSIVLCNVGSAAPARLAQQVADAYIGGSYTAAAAEGAPSNPPTATVPLTPAQRQAVAGRYRSDELGVVYTVALDGDRLVLRRRYQDDVPMVATGPDAFRAGTLRLAFTRAGSSVAGFVVDAGRARNLRFIREPS